MDIHDNRLSMWLYNLVTDRVKGGKGKVKMVLGDKGLKTVLSRMFLSQVRD